MKNEHKLVYLEDRIRFLEAEIEQLTKENLVLQEKHEIQETVFNKSLVGYYIFVGGVFRMINPVVSSYTNYTPEEIVGNRADFMVFPEDKSLVRKKAKAMLAGELLSPYEFRIITKDNKIRWVAEAVAAITFDGRPAVVGNAMDITKQKESERMLWESGNLYRTIFETTGTGVVIIEDNKILSLINSEFEKITGYSREEW